MWSSKVIRKKAREAVAGNYNQWLCASAIFAAIFAIKLAIIIVVSLKWVLDLADDFLYWLISSAGTSSSMEAIKAIARAVSLNGLDAGGFVASNSNNAILSSLSGDDSGWGWFIILIICTVLVIFFILADIVAVICIYVAQLFATVPLRLSVKAFALANISQRPQFSLKGFIPPNNPRNVWIRLKKDISILLRSLLLVVPGIIRAYELRLVPYICLDNPGLPSKEVLALSKKMMTGNKWRAFVFDLGFIGWFLLSIIGVLLPAFFYVVPYYQQASAMLYDAIKVDYINQQRMAAAQPTAPTVHTT